MPACIVKATAKGEFWTGERCYITELSNTELSPASSLAIARVEAGVTTQLHSLTGITETYIVIAGTGNMEVSGESFEIRTGDQVVVPAGASQRITAVGEADLRFYCLCTPRFVPATYVNLEEAARGRTP
jgi:mannose-6-phosphate isomerase-like protein (cupin superfamily)